MTTRSHPWPGKLGPPDSPCVSAHTGPTGAELAAPAQKYACAQAGCVCTPLIASDGSVFITEGQHPKGEGILKVSREGAETFVKISGVLGTPALVQDKLYAASDRGDVFSVSTATCEIQWHKKVCGAFPQDHWSVSANSNVAVLPGILVEPADFAVLPPANHVFAVSTRNGDVKWKFQPQALLTNFTGSIVGDVVVFTDLAGGIYCLKLTDGSVRWQMKGEGSMVSRCMGGAIAVDGVVYHTFNFKAKKAFNAPCGGKGAVRAYDLKTGKQKWESPFDMEAHVVPALLPKKLAGGEKDLLLVPLGANAGSLPPAAPAGDEWRGQIVALDAKTGSLQWTFEPPPHKSPICAGTNNVSAWKVNAWSSPACGADGTAYVCWHGGSLYALDGASGRLAADVTLGSSVQGTPAIGDRMLAVATLSLCAIWSPDLRPDTFRTSDNLLARPLAESGVEHFNPCRVGQHMDKPYRYSWLAPNDLSKPTWCSRYDDRKLNDVNNGGIVIDSQKNLYAGYTYGHFVSLRPDGSFRAGLDTLHLGVVNPCLHDRHLILDNHAGQISAYDLETMELTWCRKYAAANGESGCAMSCRVLDGTVFIPARSDYGCGGENAMIALHAADGSLKWRWDLPDSMKGSSCYNTFPQLVQVSDKAGVVFGTCNGGVVVLNFDDGHLLYQWQPPYDSFSTGGPTVGPDGIVYIASNFPDPRGSVRALDVGAEKVRWELDTGMTNFCTQVPLVVPRELVDGEGGDLVVVGTGFQVCGNPSDADFLKFACQGAVQGALLGLDGDTGRERWRFVPPPHRSAYPCGCCDGDTSPPDAWSSAVVDGRGTIYVYWQAGYLHAVNSSTGAEISRYFLGAFVNGAPAIAPGMLVVAAHDRIVCWRDAALEEQWLAENSGDPRAKVPWGALKGQDVREEVANPPVPLAKRPLDKDLPGAAPAPVSKEAARSLGGEGATWVVVGGGEKGGIVVRKGEGLKSEELPRLATGARIREIEKKGDRLHYEKVSGGGPDSGWVSLTFKGSPLIQPE